MAKQAYKEQYVSHVCFGLLRPHEQHSAIWIRDEPFDIIRQEGAVETFKNQFGTRKVILDTFTGIFTVLQKEVEDV